ncbi:hypothetical protein ABCS02_27855 [Microbacterium sp. X-17]|uniref:hypothetical protein n=1 Tax=Microbacterium sp. X-17 TaxID=3144404 RepID=UPI0031F50D25
MRARAAEAGPPRPVLWLAASVPVALVVDALVAGFGRFAWCGFGCSQAPGDVGVALGSLAIVAVVTFLAVALPPWIPGWRRPVIAAGAALMVVGIGAFWVFLFG